LFTFEANLIGEGGYAEVYLGKLEDGNFVAIKRLTRGNQEEMTADFLSELGIIVHVDHPNIARLIGYGVEGGMFLVLQLSPHGSLSSILYGINANQLTFWVFLSAMPCNFCESYNYSFTLHDFRT